MRWFNKKQTKERGTHHLPKIPKISELPHLPDDDLTNENRFPVLPDISNNDYAEDKFSQNTIKEAVSGGKEEEEFGDFLDEAEKETPTLPTLPKVEEIGNNPPVSLQENSSEEDHDYEEQLSAPIKEEKKVKEPIFIRIDKFEESLENFRKIKAQVTRIKKMLDNTKEIKQQEQKELESWEEKLKSVKKSIEKIDREIFSKI